MCDKQHAPCYDICHGCYFQVIGTVVTLAGAMLMTLYKGQVISFLGSKYMHHPTNYVPKNNTDSGEKDWFKGSVLLAVTLRKYPAQLSLTALVCAFGTLCCSLCCITYYVQGIVMQKLISGVIRAILIVMGLHSFRLEQ
ncbi:hypothetical protein JHK84_055380 [Glycine max]|nr:hypothetical protein JHK86_055341 [Glycine max]KAG5074149.1 hypothetical protein JHK84_055380 [Glycine max]